MAQEKEWLVEYRQGNRWKVWGVYGHDHDKAEHVAANLEGDCFCQQLRVREREVSHA